MSKTRENNRRKQRTEREELQKKTKFDKRGKRQRTRKDAVKGYLKEFGE